MRWVMAHVWHWHRLSRACHQDRCWGQRATVLRTVKVEVKADGKFPEHGCWPASTGGCSIGTEGGAVFSGRRLMGHAFR